MIPSIKITTAAILLAFAAAHGLVAEDFILKDGREYKDVKIARTEPDGIVIHSDAGIEKIAFTSLPEEVAEKHGYDPAKAKAFEGALAEAKRKRQQSLAEDAQKRANDAKQRALLEEKEATSTKMKFRVIDVLKDGDLYVEPLEEQVEYMPWWTGTGKVGILTGYKGTVAEGDEVGGIGYDDGVQKRNGRSLRAYRLIRQTE